MKIVHLGKYYWPAHGGIETAVQQMALAGLKLGHDVHCIVSQKKTSVRKTVENIDGVKVTRLPVFAKLLSTPLSPFVFEDLGEVLEGYDVVHLHLPHPMAELKVLFSTKRSAHLIPYFHAFPIRQGQIGRLWFKWITSKILERSKFILVSTSNMSNVFPQIHPWKEKIRVLPFTAEAWSEGDFQSQSSLRSGSKQVLSIGRLVRYKGYDVLIKAWALAHKTHPQIMRDFQLKIVGDGPCRGELERLVAKVELTSSVFFPGECSEQERSKLYRESTLFVAPSLDNSETFGLAVLEAMGTGLPVIASRLPTGLSVLTRGGLCGAEVLPKSEEDLAQALIRLLEDQRLRNECGHRNLQYVREQHSSDQMMRLYHELLVNLD